MQDWDIVSNKKDSLDEKVLIHTTFSKHHGVCIHDTFFIKSPLPFHNRQILTPTWFHLHIFLLLWLHLKNYNQWHCLKRIWPKHASDMSFKVLEYSCSSPWENRVCQGVCSWPPFIAFWWLCLMCFIKINDSMKDIMLEGDFWLQIICDEEWIMNDYNDYNLWELFLTTLIIK